MHGQNLPPPMIRIQNIFWGSSRCIGKTAALCEEGNQWSKKYDCHPGLYKISCCLRAKCLTGLVPTIFKVVWAWLCLILSFFPFFFFLSSLFFLFFHFYSLSLLSPIFSFFFLSPPCLQNGVGAYKRRLLAWTLCRALPIGVKVL